MTCVFHCTSLKYEPRALKHPAPEQDLCRTRRKRRKRGKCRILHRSALSGECLGRLILICQRASKKIIYCQEMADTAIGHCVWILIFTFWRTKKILEYEFPDHPLRLPEEPKKRKGPRQSQRIYESGTSVCIDDIVVVKRYRTLDKKPMVVKAVGSPFSYEFGRIQLTVPKEFIGIEAKVHIEFPNAPKIVKRRRRGRRQFGYFQI